MQTVYGTIVVEVLEEDCERCQSDVFPEHEPPFMMCDTHLLKTLHILEQKGFAVRQGEESDA